MSEDDKKKQGKRYIEYTLFAMVGTQLVVSIFVGFGIGYWLDNWLNTKPAFMLVFTVFGVISGFLNVYRTLNKER